VAGCAGLGVPRDWVMAPQLLESGGNERGAGSECTVKSSTRFSGQVEVEKVGTSWDVDRLASGIML
jgi:hypothetical protein